MRRISTSSLGRRAVLRWAAGVALLTLVSASPAAAQASATITDIRGRSVAIPRGPQRLLIDDGRYLIALSLIHPDPVSLLTAWPRDINRISQPVYDRYRARFPRIDQLTTVASSAGTFSLEQAIASAPTVAIFSLGQGPTDPQIRQLEAAGIAVVFIDFFTQPFEHLERSLTILGQIAGRDAQARNFLDWRRARMSRIAAAVKAQAGPAPKVFLEAHAGLTACCNSPGKGNIGDYISFVGGHNIGADVLPGAFGRLNVEYVVAQNPDVYILTGGPHIEKAGGYVVGPGYTVERSRQAIQAMTARTGLGLLAAVKTGRVHGLSHQLLNSPLDILAVESLARWIHPRLFGAIDPAATLREINERFLAVPLDGPLWTDLR
jgi:iron complex transport system substrate-binding protein